MAASASSLAILPSGFRGSRTKIFDLRSKPTNNLVFSVSSSSNSRQKKSFRVLASVSVSDPPVRSSPDDLVASILSKVMGVVVDIKSSFLVLVLIFLVSRFKMIVLGQNVLMLIIAQMKKLEYTLLIFLDFDLLVEEDFANKKIIKIKNPCFHSLNYYFSFLLYV